MSASLKDFSVFCYSNIKYLYFLLFFCYLLPVFLKMAPKKRGRRSGGVLTFDYDSILKSAVPVRWDGIVKKKTFNNKRRDYRSVSLTFPGGMIYHNIQTCRDGYHHKLGIRVSGHPEEVLLDNDLDYYEHKWDGIGKGPILVMWLDDEIINQTITDLGLSSDPNDDDRNLFSRMLTKMVAPIIVDPPIHFNYTSHFFAGLKSIRDKYPTEDIESNKYAAMQLSKMFFPLGTTVMHFDDLDYSHNFKDEAPDTECHHHHHHVCVKYT